MEKHEWKLGLIGEVTILSVQAAVTNTTHWVAYLFLTAQEVGKSRVKGVGRFSSR